MEGWIEVALAAPQWIWLQIRALAGRLDADPTSVGLALLVPALLLFMLVRRLTAPLRGPQALEHEVQRLIERSDYERAGDLRMGQGEFEKALALFLNGRVREKAALCHLALKQPHRAGEMYRELGRHAEAAHHFQTAGSWREAAECLQRIGSEREAAELFERAGDAAKAAHLLRSLGDSGPAARLFERAGLRAEAAAAMLHSRGQEPVTLRKAAGLFREAGQLRRAGECLAAAGAWQDAAEVFEQAGENMLAAQAYERGSRWDGAAAAYERAGALPEARTNFERAGDLGRAAEVALRMGNLLDAGRNLYQLGAYERAIETLQQIASDSPQWRRAGALLGRIFLEKGLAERARQKLSAIPVGATPSKDDLEVLSLLAGACERLHDVREAAAVLERICAADESFDDAGRRLEALQEKLWSESNPPPGYYDARYELRGELGRGGMGVVRLAEDRELGRPVAIKFLPGELAINPAAVAMFRQEARATAAMNHPHIVCVYDVAVIAGRPCIVMEYVKGRTLRELMKAARATGGALPPKQVVQLAHQIALALAYAHSQHVVHRDVKPGNVLVSERGIAKLTDFGISKVLAAGASQTQAKGTPQYMPPEQILGRDVDGRTDLYALGISIFEMATGRRPFVGENVVEQQLHSPLPDPRQWNPAVPEGLTAIIRRACEKRPEDRYPSGEALAEALAELRTKLGS